VNQQFRSAEIGILIGERNAWGQGLGSEAIALLADHAFRRMNLNRLGAGTVAENIGCIRAFERAGFIREGVSRQAYFCDGQYRDVVHLGFLRNEWQQRL
jgi:RimJ/RimL family protein N-acetyltransferase